MENQNLSGEIYTLGIWKVIPGKEKEFIDQWTLFAQWTSKNLSGAGKGYLLQDETNSSRFISFGPWANRAIIQAWRESFEFKNFVRIAKELCEEFQPNTLRVVASS
jgi:heme-degrading monooxygenase HmoA